MIISNNRNSSLVEFKSLIDEMTVRLNNDAVKRKEYYLKRNAQLLEDDVKSMLDLVAIGTNFEGTIEKISGQRFPDIVAGKYYGVEVKSSKDERWLTIGGSVNESTRIEGVERIFLTFGKLVSPVEFRSRPYEDCLSDVVVTHYPRYKINMNLSKDETIFSKMKTTYDKLRLSDDPVEQIINYYKGQLNEGESLWWTGKKTQLEHVESVPMKIRMWRTLSEQEKNELMLAGFAYFPDLLSNSSKKYERFSLWLAANHGVVSTSVRDSFTAGGQGTIKVRNFCFDKIPRAIIKIHENSKDIENKILNADENILRETWNVNKVFNDRVGQWIDSIANLCSIKNYDVLVILKAIFNINN